MKKLIQRLFTYPLRGKRLLWTTHVRIFTDGGQMKWRWIPRIRHSYYAPFWGMNGFAIYLWGREINFSFGKDHHGLYK